MRKAKFILVLFFLTFFLKNDILSPTNIPFPLPPISISPDGKANLSIPIDLPPGTKDLIPSLSLSYNSGNKTNGLLGIGWNLDGLPVVMRDPSFPIHYDAGDHFLSSLGGQLVRGVDGYYYHRKENFTRFQAMDSNCAGPCQWIATDSGGTKYYFGASVRRGQILTMKSNQAPVGSVRVWALSEVRDLFGNGYTINYISEEDGSYYPSNIQYNNRSIVFTYQDKTAAEQIPNYM